MVSSTDEIPDVLQGLMHQLNLASASPASMPPLAVWIVPQRDIMGGVASALLASKEVAERSRGSRVAVTLLVQAYRYSTCAFFLAQRCYYEQALTLARSCLESCQLAELTAKRDDIAEEWFRGKTSSGKPFHTKWSAKAVREAIGETKDMYSFLCDLGTHPRAPSTDGFAYVRLATDGDSTLHLDLTGTPMEPMIFKTHTFVLSMSSRILASAIRIGIQPTPTAARTFTQGQVSFNVACRERAQALKLPHEEYLEFIEMFEGKLRDIEALSTP